MAEHVLIQQALTRTADQLYQQLCDSDVREARIWLFEDRAARQALAEQLATHGIRARVRSAYKPLVHFFLEEVDTSGLTGVHITYPVHPACRATRFQLETYPLAQMLDDDIDLAFSAADVSEQPTDICYQVMLTYGDRHRQHRVFAPNQLRRDFLGQQVCIPSAWLVTGTGVQREHKSLEAEYLQCYDAVMQAVTAHDWGHTEPYFDHLSIRADLPGVEHRLPVGHETMSTAEALHEELYFSLLEFFQHHSGRAQGNRGLQPGQIIPDIRRTTDGSARVRITYAPATTVPDHPTPEQPSLQTDDQSEPLSLAEAEAPLTLAQIRAATHRLPGEHFTFASRQQRPVHGAHIGGHLPAVVLSAAQHANETTGVVGALRATETLRHLPGAHMVLLPTKNPDGYALHQELCKHNPRHMHHAARYSALGDDIEHRETAPWFERHALNHAFAISGAELHLNLHGYPAHEWTRPCTGYLPRGFEIWSIPKGFFLILRYREHHQDKAMRLLDHVSRQLARNTELMTYNRRQLACYQKHAGHMPFDIMHGVPYMATAVDDSACDVTLITEFPDETIYGDDFVFGHTVQMQTVLAATRWWWGLTT